VQPGEFTVLLQQCSKGNKEALDALTPVVYAELHRLAASLMRNERPGGTLQPTALIHEAYLQLVLHDPPDFQSRAHFYGVAAHIMRQLLIAHARRFRAQKRNGGERVAFEEDLPIPDRQSEELLALDEALERLAERDARKAQAIELKYFGGLDHAEIGAALGVSLATVKRDIAVAEAWLRRMLSGRGAEAVWPT
jgi:RNA polymerase sigma factor (TIGR02999 family)